MPMSDIFAVTRTSDGSVYGARARVRQVVVHTSGSGSPAIVLKNGGAGGTVLLSVTFSTSDVFALNIPDNGILFETDVFIDLTDCSSVTVFMS